MKIDLKLNNLAAVTLSYSIEKMYPNAQVANIGINDDGFYCDFALPTSISEHDLKNISNEMVRATKKQINFVLNQLSKLQAKKLFIKNKYFLDSIENIIGNIITLNTEKNDFNIILSSDEVLKNAKDLKYFTLLSTAGSYWKNDAKNIMLTRIYGTAWSSKAELDEFLNYLEERKLSDHRWIGKQLNLFMFDELAGQGMPIWLPNGTIIKNEITKYLNQKELEYNFVPVSTPVLGSVQLYKTSGHWDHYRKNMFPLMNVEGEELVLRPMTCPHHTLIYKHELRSHRDLPLRLSENALLHRYESSGSLTGLERVRAMLLTDAHIFCRPDQIEKEMANAYNLIKEVLEALNIKINYVSLSLRDKNDNEKYFKNDAMWDAAENDLRKLCKNLNINAKEMIGEAAFYGPKIDFQIKTVLGHEITISTLQLDFLLPERFNMEYKDKDGTMKRPVLIHRGLIGTFERFMAILLEQTKGILPLWISPVQIMIIPVNEKIHIDFCDELKQKLFKLNIRAKVDNREERLAKKIRDSQIKKVPYQIVIGDDEIKDKINISYREYGKQEINKLSFDKFVAMLQTQIGKIK